MIMKITLNPEYEDEKKTLKSDRILLILLQILTFGGYASD